jgi:FAD/FMN-containing dehydrogenase
MTLIHGFRGDVLFPGHPDYDEARRVWNGEIDRRPALIARCLDEADVRAGLAHARAEGLEVTIRGGGHNVGGFAVADGAVTLDLSRLDRVEVNPATRTVRAGAGVLLGGLDRATQKHHLAVPVGINTTTGLAGLTLGGGIGWLMRAHGLTVDNLLEVDLVSADGTAVTANDRDHPELFWAIRGAGTNFGVVTRFTFRAHPVGPVVLAGPLLWRLSDAPDVLRGYSDMCAALPAEVTTICALRQAPPAPWIPEALHGTHVLQILACHTGQVEDARTALAPLRALGRPLVDHIEARSFLEVQSFLDASVPKGWQYYWKSHYLPPLTDEVIDTLVEHSFKITSPRSYTLLPQLGGAVSRVAEDATAYSHRDAAHAVNINAVWLPGDPRRREHIAWARDLFTALEPYGSGVYVNFLGREGAARVQAAYGEEKMRRLTDIKTAWDPDNVFHVNQNIPPHHADVHQRPAEHLPA